MWRIQIRNHHQLDTYTFAKKKKKGRKKSHTDTILHDVVMRFGINEYT